MSDTKQEYLIPLPFPPLYFPSVAVDLQSVFHFGICEFMDPSSRPVAIPTPIGVANTLALVPLSSKRKAESPVPVPVHPSGLTTRESSATVGKRKRFNPERRAEVAKTRKNGACILCRIRKVTVREAVSFLCIRHGD